MDFSVIIPTYREAANIPLLVHRIAGVNMGNGQFEVLLIDDNSQDGTIEIVQELRQQHPWLKLIVRQKARDLSLSIMDGFEAATYPVLITMDADLSHPPESIPVMLQALANQPVDVVIGSRYIAGGSSDTHWPFTRRVISRAAAVVASMLLMRGTKDPLSGFIAFKKDILSTGDILRPIGWKIGLELMVKCRCKNIREIPIHFSQRVCGKSKLGFKASFNFLRHVAWLKYYQHFVMT